MFIKFQARFFQLNINLWHQRESHLTDEHDDDDKKNSFFFSCRNSNLITIARETLTLFYENGISADDLWHLMEILSECISLNHKKLSFRTL